MPRKIVFNLIVALLFVTFIPLGANTAEAQNTPDKPAKTSISINGEKSDIIFEPRSGGYDYLIAAADFARITGSTYKFYPGSGMVTLQKGSRVIELYIDSPSSTIDSHPATISQPPRTADGIIYVPLNLTASSLGFKLSVSKPGPSFNIITNAVTDNPVPVISADRPEKLIPENSEFMAGNPSVADSVYTKGDLNGDGNDEFAALYRREDGKGGILLYGKDTNQYRKLWLKEDYFSPTLLEIEDFGTGGLSLVTGWDLGHPLGSYLEIYSVSNNSVDLIYSDIYHEAETGDFDGDGKKDLALWQKDTADTYNIKVFKWDGKKFASLEFCPGYYEKVMDYYEKLQNSSRSRAVYYRMAEACWRAEKFDLALKYALEGINLPPGYPTNESFNVIRGLALTEMNRHTEAIPVLKQALEGYQGAPAPEARFALSLSYLKTGNSERGMQELARAVNEGNDWPGFLRAYNILKEQISLLTK